MRDPRRIAGYLDVTSLNGFDIPGTIEVLCDEVQNALETKDLRVAAVCVFPVYVRQVRARMEPLGINTASVAGAFPHGLSHLSIRTQEIRACVEDGANEVDVVIRRSNALEGHWTALEDELHSFREAAGTTCLKVILEVSELEDSNIVRHAADLCVSAGCDFVKTATGKSKPILIDQAKPIWDALEGTEVGFKAAGGIRTLADALDWESGVREALGDHWLNPSRFRLGTSHLLQALTQPARTDTMGR